MRQISPTTDQSQVLASKILEELVNDTLVDHVFTANDLAFGQRVGIPQRIFY